MRLSGIRMNKKISFTVFFFYIILYCPVLYPQNLEFIPVDYSAMIRSGNFNCIYEDQEGFIWFGTNNGLYRYDGIKYEQFFHYPGDTLSLSNNNVLCMGEDATGKLWIGTANGLNLYNKQNKSFTWFLQSENNKSSISDSWIKSLLLFQDSLLLIGTRKGLNKLVKTKNNKIYFKKYFPERRNQQSKSEWSIECIHEDYRGEIWVGTWGGGLVHFDINREKFSHFFPDFRTKSRNDNVIVCIESKNDSILWAASYNGIIHTFNTRSKEFVMDPDDHFLFGELKKGNISIYSLIKDKRDNLWIGSTSRLIVMNAVKNTIEHNGTPVNPENPKKYKDQAKTIFEDSNGLIWIGYMGHGIDLYDRDYKKLLKWHHKLNSSEKHRDYITDLRLDNYGNVWLTTWGDGLLKTNMQGEVLSRHIFSSITNSTSNDIITSIEMDVRGNLWLGSMKGLIHFDPKKGKLVNIINHDPNKTESLSDNHIYKIVKDNNGMLWIITQEGIRLLDPIHEKVQTVPFIENSPLNKFFCVLKDVEENYWFGTMQGLVYYNKQDKKFTYYNSDPKKQNSLISNEIKCLHQDAQSNIWIGTNNGLTILDLDREQFTNMRYSNGQDFGSVMAFEQDNKNRVWILTAHDLSVYNPYDSSLTTYTKEDGLSSFANSLSIDKFNYLLIADEKGYYRIHPDSIHQNKNIPPVYITGIYLSGKKVAVNESPLYGTAAMFKNKITLKYTENNFGFLFSSLNYKHPEKNQFKYKLHGFNDSWIHHGTKNEVSFMNLPHGKYTFMVKGSNDDLFWNENPAMMEVRILPPPWQTWWAYMIYILLITSFIIIYRHITITRERERNMLAIDQMKLSFFINISHELRTPLTLITGPLERLLQKEQNTEKKAKLSLVFRNASRMQQLINQLLDIRKVEVGKLKPVIYKLHLNNFIDTILESFKIYANDNHIGFYFYNQVTESTIWSDPDMLEKAISNLLINAFKYTPVEGEVSIRLFEHKPEEIKNMYEKYIKEMHVIKYNERKNLEKCRYISIEIADCGEGLSDAEMDRIFDRFYQDKTRKRNSSIGSGIGLSLTKDLIDQLHGFIFIQSKSGMGTKFVIFIPVERSAYKNDHIKDNKNESMEFIYRDYSKILISQNILQDINKDGSAGIDETKDKRHVLVVDDNQELLDYLADILNEKYNVSLALDGENGLKKALNRKYDLIISDIMMPVMDGLEFCKRLKSDIRTSHIPVILLTAKKSIESEMAGLDEGADDYITKPFNADLLLKRVKNIIENRKKIWDTITSEAEIIPQGIKLTTRDEDFLKKAVSIIEKYLSDTDFSQEIFGSEMGMSKATLYRKINSLTNQSINEFIRTVRLKKAAEILRFGKQIHIAELAYMVGFSEPSYFTKKFRELFGMTPKVYNNRYLQKEKNTDVNIDEEGNK